MTGYTNIPRRHVFRLGLGLMAGAAASSAFAMAEQVQPGRFWMTCPRTGETIDAQYRVGTGYDGDALRRIDWFLRDWRNGKVTHMDLRTLDIVSRMQARAGFDRPFVLLSGYRSPETNDLLRRQGKGVAARSLHLSGRAIDLRIDGCEIARLAELAETCRAGGIGRYSRSGFLHVDSGRRRSWGA